MVGTGGGFAGTAKPEHKIDVPFLPWAKAAYDARNANFTKEDPEGFRLPPGIPRMYAIEGRAHMWRVVYMDGRKHTPLDKLNPTYWGEGIGHWEAGYLGGGGRDRASAY
jgi:hypothetical protein